MVYVGAEFCPYCAAERWALVAALGRFGTFSHLGATTSSNAEVFPGTPTFTFDGTTYRSRYVTFAAVEEYGDRPSRHALRPGSPSSATPHRSSGRCSSATTPRRSCPAPGTFPFVDVDNRLVVSGSGIGFSPGVLQGKSMAQIADDLSKPSNADTQAILGSANKLSAAICAATGGKPASVCTSAGVRAGASRLGLP